MVIRVLIVNDAPLYRDALAHVLEKFENITVVGTATDPDAVLAELRECQPDVILVQLVAAKGTGTLRAIADAASYGKVIALGVPNAERDIIACAEAGAAGYLLQNESLDELAARIEAVVRGEVLCSPRIAATLFRQIAELAAERRAWTAQAHLTPRELEIVELIDRGLSNKEIAQCLCIEVRTAKNHVHNILDKLQVRRRGEVAALMRENRSTPQQQIRHWL